MRFRHILMTSIATFFGALPLALAFGPGAETRSILGVVILGGVAGATLLTLFLVPVLYAVLARRTRPRAALARALGRQREKDGQQGIDQGGDQDGESPRPAPDEQGQRGPAAPGG